MGSRYATMPFPLVIAFEGTDALVPRSRQGIPHKPQRVEPLTALWRHGVFISALRADPPS
jgi:hypothetical protein